MPKPDVSKSLTRSASPKHRDASAASAQDGCRLAAEPKASMRLGRVVILGCPGKAPSICVPQLATPGTLGSGARLTQVGPVQAAQAAHLLEDAEVRRPARPRSNVTSVPPRTLRQALETRRCVSMLAAPQADAKPSAARTPRPSWRKWIIAQAGRRDVRQSIAHGRPPPDQTATFSVR